MNYFIFRNAIFIFCPCFYSCGLFNLESRLLLLSFMLRIWSFLSFLSPLKLECFVISHPFETIIFLQRKNWFREHIPKYVIASNFSGNLDVLEFKDVPSKVLQLIQIYLFWNNSSTSTTCIVDNFKDK